MYKNSLYRSLIIMIEKWSRWIPISGLEGKYYINAVSDNIEGFTVVLSKWHE